MYHTNNSQRKFRTQSHNQTYLLCRDFWFFLPLCRSSLLKSTRPRTLGVDTALACRPSVDRCSVAVAHFCWCRRAASSCRRCSARFLSVAHVTSLVLSHDSRALQFSLQFFSSVRMFSVTVVWSSWSHTAAARQHHPQTVRRPTTFFTRPDDSARAYVSLRWWTTRNNTNLNNTNLGKLTTTT